MIPFQVPPEARLFDTPGGCFVWETHLLLNDAIIELIEVGGDVGRALCAALAVFVRIR